MRPIAEGDEVRLTDHGVLVYTKRQRRYRRSVNWRGRSGIVAKFKKTGEAYVLWRGRTSLEAVPVKILERKTP
jgi:hypothetical protein